LLAAGLAFGQYWTQQAIVEVPFEFVAGNTLLPAGIYTVSTPAGGNNGSLMFGNKNSAASVLATNIDVSAKSAGYNPTSSLVFVVDTSGRRVLHQAWIMGQGHGHDLIHEKGIPEPK
jgi:hypothetical protein